MNKFVVMSADDSYDNIDLIDTINEQEQEIDRLNNIINELEKWITKNGILGLLGKTDNYFVDGKKLLDKLKKLKGE